ncbi:MAG: HypC/HybG/HupF family hydrogenase formation chaperone [Aquificaceae bacterium]
MCLSIPSKVLEIRENNTALVEAFGARKFVSLDLLQEEVRVGDYVLVHVGFAIQKLDEKYALDSLRLFEEMLELEDEA